MTLGLLGRKQGMTRIIGPQGLFIAVTVVAVMDNEVLHVKTAEANGKNAVVLGFDPYHKASKNKKFKVVKEFTVDDAAKYTKGQKLSVEQLKDIKMADVSSISKGKGFQGVIKRHGFAGGKASHGSHFHREPGSIGQRARPGKVQKGKKLPGHMGSDRKTLRDRPILGIDEKAKTVLVQGTVPGARNTLVEMRF